MYSLTMQYWGVLLGGKIAASTMRSMRKESSGGIGGAWRIVGFELGDDGNDGEGMRQ